MSDVFYILEIWKWSSSHLKSLKSLISEVSPQYFAATHPARSVWDCYYVSRGIVRFCRIVTLNSIEIIRLLLWKLGRIVRLLLWTSRVIVRRRWCIYYTAGWFRNTLIGPCSVSCHDRREEVFRKQPEAENGRYKFLTIPQCQNRALESHGGHDMILCRQFQLCNVADDFTKTKVKSWLFEDWKRDHSTACL